MCLTTEEEHWCSLGWCLWCLIMYCASIFSSSENNTIHKLTGPRNKIILGAQNLENESDCSRREFCLCETTVHSLDLEAYQEIEMWIVEGDKEKLELKSPTYRKDGKSLNF